MSNKAVSMQVISEQKSHISKESLEESPPTTNHQIQSSKESNGENDSNRTKSGEFLLAEFNQLYELWCYTDKRIENSLNIYLTVSSLIVTSLTFIFQQVQDLHLLITLTIPIALTLLIGGIILTKRIQETDILKARYIYALNLIRNYFADNDTKIAAYLFLRFDIKPNIRSLLNIGFLLRSTLLWNSLLLGYIIAVCAWLIEPRFSLGFLVGIGIAIVLVTFVLLNYLTKRRIETE